jgi:hypothetical protein
MTKLNRIMTLNNNATRPRTGPERLAYLTGYAQAINDIHEHGIHDAQNFLRESYEAEAELPDPR